MSQEINKAIHKLAVDIMMETELTTEKVRKYLVEVLFLMNEVASNNDNEDK